MHVSGHSLDGKANPDELVELLLDHVPVAIAIFDLEMRYVACNQKWIDDNGLSGTQIIGCSHYEIFPEIGEEWRALHDRVFAGETLSRDRDPFPRADGSIDWTRWTMAPWRDTGGRIRGLLLVAEYLTAQIADQLRSRVLQEEMSLFIDIADDLAVFMIDEARCITIWNSGAERMFGWNENEVLGKSFARMSDPADTARGLPTWQLESARETGTFRDRCWRIRKDGSRFLADITINFIEGDAILPGGYGVLVRDVTSEDSRARSLEASSVLLRSILDTVPDAVIVIDDHGTMLSFSKAAEQLFGYERSEVIGKNVSILMPSPDREQHDSYLERYRDTGKTQIIGNNRRVLGQRKDGTTFPHTLRIGEAFGGGQRMFAGFLHDLTEAERTETELHELQRELTHIARISEMGTLATTMAHELNQPLMAISNMVQTSSELLKRGNDKQVLELVRTALDETGREALRAGAIVKRLRGFVSRGELERTIEEPGLLVEDACKLVVSESKLRNIRLSIHVEKDTENILVDRVQIQQVVLNLVRNALEVTADDGEVCITVRPAGAAIEFMVADSGPGVPPDRIERLFAPFSTTKPEGMGMGLSICKTIVEAHDGKIWYEDAATGGAAFLFTVPAFNEEYVDGK